VYDLTAFDSLFESEFLNVRRDMPLELFQEQLAAVGQQQHPHPSKDNEDDDDDDDEPVAQWGIKHWFRFDSILQASVKTPSKRQKQLSRNSHFSTPQVYDDKPWNPIGYYGLEIKDRSAELFDYFNVGRLTEPPEKAKRSIYNTYMAKTQPTTLKSKKGGITNDKPDSLPKEFSDSENSTNNNNSGWNTSGNATNEFYEYYDAYAKLSDLVSPSTSSMNKLEATYEEYMAIPNTMLQ